MPLPTAHARPPSPRRVLIVRPSALGDVSRTVPALATLRRMWPEARIDWLVARSSGDVIRHHPMLDQVIAYDRRWLSALARGAAHPREAWWFMRRLRDAAYDRVYDLQGLLRSGLFSYLTHAARRVGFADAREFGWLGYNVRHRVERNGPHRHTVDHMLGLLEADGLEPVRDMRLYVGQPDRNFLTAFRESHGIRGDYACLAPTARWESKCWPLDRYADIARRLLETGLAGDRLIVLCSPHESAGVRELADRLPRPLRERVIFPPTTVGQMMALLSQTRLLVCNDSAPLHIAVGFDRPVVAIFGPTDPAEVGPYRREASVVRPNSAVRARAAASHHRRRRDQTLIAQVGVEAVWRKVQATLGEGPG